MNKHTPGPWKVKNLDIVIGPKGNVISECCGYSDKAIDKNQKRQGGRESNAKLIAAAPDSLKANISALACLVNLRELLRLDKSENDFSDEVIDCIKELNAAIKKATE